LQNLPDEQKVGISLGAVHKRRPHKNRGKLTSSPFVRTVSTPLFVRTHNEFRKILSFCAKKCGRRPHL